MQPQVAYLLLIIAALVLLGGTGGYAWRNRRAPGGTHFLRFVAGAWAWTFLVGAMAVADPSTARILLSVKYLAIGSATAASFLFIAHRTGRLTRLTRGQVSLFFVIPLVGSVASCDDRAGMIRRVSFGEAFELTHVASISFGPVYWLFTGYGYALILSSLAFLVLARREGVMLARAQAAPLLLGVAAPMVSNILLITGIAPRAFDPMPFGLGISSLCLWWGAFRGRLLDIVPVARSVLVDSLQDGILIVDRERRILDVNTHFAQMAGLAPAQLVGKILESCAWPDASIGEALRAALQSARGGGTPARTSPSAPNIALRTGGRAFDVRVLRVAAGDADTEARIVVLQDVSERQGWQDEQARLIAELQDALGQVKTLSGLLPICAGCKQIRDGGGGWQPIEVYIRDRTNAEFSHGMCPTCVERWYPE